MLVKFVKLLNVHVDEGVANITTVDLLKVIAICLLELGLVLNDFLNLVFALFFPCLVCTH